MINRSVIHGINVAQRWPLQRHSADMALSCQRISRTYTGAWASIRRESDNDVLDIPFKGTTPDSKALLDFTGTGVSAAGHIVRWYTQASNGWDAEQSENTNQPLVVDGGVRIVDANGRQSIQFSGTSHFLNVNDLDARNLFRNIPRAAVMAVATNKNPSAYTGNILDVNLEGSIASVLNLRLVTAAQHRTAATARKGAFPTYELANIPNPPMDTSGIDFVYQHSGYYAWQSSNDEFGTGNGAVVSRVNNGHYRNQAGFSNNEPAPDETPSGINIGARGQSVDFYNGLISEVIVVVTDISHESDILPVELSQMRRWQIDV